MRKEIRVIHSDCDPSISEDRTLPSNAYLVEYLQDGVTHFDVVTCQKKVEIFDEYWDKYKKDLINITQTEGRINPKLWGYKAPDDKKKK
tara:strand:+ start:1008 stop:1274 length:267 start_codon:yes stop_codon:yes gene_type:complete